MLDIISRFTSKSNLDLNSLYFLFEGKILDKENKFAEITKSDSIQILVYEIKDNEPNPNLIESNKIKSKYIICPKCNENAIIHFDSNKIKISNCRNGHELKNILWNEFEEIQKYEMNSINCQNCKKINKSETTYNEFYKCLICNIYLCPLCKTIHDKSHNIINMDKNYICSIHNESYSIYCSDCKINSCIQCFNEKHKNHKKIFFADIMPNMDEINNKMKD